MERLEEKLAEIDSYKQEDSNAISKAEQLIQIQKESTSGHVLRLQGRVACCLLYAERFEPNTRSLR